MRDELITGLRLARAGLWLAGDRLQFSSTASAIPRDLAALDAGWLTAALAASLPGVRVRSVERLGGHSGTTTRERIRVHYDRGSGDLPETIFVKLTPGDVRTQLFVSLMQLGRNEVGFYRDIRGDVPVLTPRPYCARAASRGPRFILLLEDLTARGARFATLDEPVTLERARAVMRMLGRLHAAFWESPRFGGDLAWLRARETNRNLPVERLVSARSNAPAIAAHGDVVPAAVRERSHLVHLHRDALEDYWAKGPRTLLHGDSHVGNMFFLDDEAGLLDWQVTQRGQGIRDVGYFLMNSVDVELRRAHERELVDLWRETLIEHRVAGADLPNETIWERYRSQALYVWISSAVAAAVAGLQPRNITRRGIERAGAALEDHDALALLEHIARR